MAAPFVDNLQPQEGAEGFTPTDFIRLSTRDGESSVDKTTISTILTFSKSGYFPSALPAGNAYLDVFDDALPQARPGVNVDRYITEEIPYDSDGDTIDDSVYGPVLTLEKAIAGESTEQGVLFVEADAGEVTPVGCEIQLGIQSFTRGAASYFPDADFVGVVAGFIYWPLNTGVFVFFKEDGLGNYSIEVTGPAQDGSGTRLVSTVTTLDWSVDLHAPVSIRVVWDPTPRSRKVWVLATNESSGTYEETLLFEELIEDLGEFQASARLGIGYAESPPNKIVAFGGISSGDVSDFVEVHNINVDAFGAYVLASGGGTASSEYAYEPSDSLLVSQYEDTAKWDTSTVEDIVTDAGATFTIEKESGATTAAISFVERDLSRQRFALLVSGSIRSESHVGSQSTGAGVDIDDGTALTSLRFLDDFSDKRIGVLYDDTNLDATASFYAADSTWDQTTPEILVLADAAQNLLDVYISETSTSVGLLSEVAVEAPYSVVSPTYGAPSVAVGFLDGPATGLEYAGNFVVDKVLLLPNAYIFSPRSAVAEGATALPNQVGTWQAWTLTFSGAPTITAAPSEADPYWTLVPAVSTDYAFYSLEIPADEYNPGENGVSVFAYVQVNSWIDQFGADSTPRIPTCAVMALDAGSDLFVQLQFVVTSTGEAYAFLANSPSDYLDVLSQNLAGQERSALVDLSAPHTYLLSYKPGKGVFLYIDLSDTPAASFAWADRSSAELESDYLVAGMTAAVGIIPVSTAGESASLTLGNIVVSVGSGFDYSAALSVSDDVLEESVYGAEANVFVDVTDKD
jgi:hypothetical protein